MQEHTSLASLCRSSMLSTTCMLSSLSSNSCFCSCSGDSCWPSKCFSLAMGWLDSGCRKASMQSTTSFSLQAHTWVGSESRKASMHSKELGEASMHLNKSGSSLLLKHSKIQLLACTRPTAATIFKRRSCCYRCRCITSA